MNAGKWVYTQNIIESTEEADAIIILTEWSEYFMIDWEKVSKKMRRPAWIFDARSVLNPEDIKNFDLNLWRVGDGSIL